MGGPSVDVVQFALAPIPFRRADIDAGDEIVFVSVNGRDLIEAIHTYERQLAVDAGYRPPMPYAALPANRVLPPSLQWLGRPSEDLTHGDWVVVFTCGCGDWSCGGLLARIDVGDDLVVWSDFQTPYRLDRMTEQPGVPVEGDVSRDGLGPFRFKRSQYEAALRHPGSRGHTPMRSTPESRPAGGAAETESVPHRRLRGPSGDGPDRHPHP